jgi:3-oxoacyl-[acyl-carrier protein] reductase
MTKSQQVAIVTGGSRGIGRAISNRLASQGASICVNYSAQPEPADTLVKDLIASGTSAIAVRADVSDPTQVEALIAQTDAELGPPTILVNNAGVSTPRPWKPTTKRPWSTCVVLTSTASSTPSARP